MWKRVGFSPITWLLVGFALAGFTTPLMGQHADQRHAAADTVQLAAKNASGITGMVVTVHKGDSVSVTVSLKGGAAGAVYATHIHSGTCEQPGGVVAALQSVPTGPGGSGSVVTMLAVAKLAEADHSAGMLVQAHQPGGAPAACGGMEGRHNM